MKTIPFEVTGGSPTVLRATMPDGRIVEVRAASVFLRLEWDEGRNDERGMPNLTAVHEVRFRVDSAGVVIEQSALQGVAGGGN